MGARRTAVLTFHEWNGISDHQSGSAASQRRTESSLQCCWSVSQLWPLTLDRPRPQRRGSTEQSLLWSPPPTLLAAAFNRRWQHHNVAATPSPADSPLWQLNTQVRVLLLVPLWLATSVWLSCLIPHRVWVVGPAARRSTDSGGQCRTNKHAACSGYRFGIKKKYFSSPTSTAFLNDFFLIFISYLVHSNQPKCSPLNLHVVFLNERFSCCWMTFFLPGFL